jgi:RND family efflux transporter MFP subunit
MGMQIARKMLSSMGCAMGSLVILLVLSGCEKEKPAQKEPVVRPVKMMVLSELAQATRRTYPGKAEAVQWADLSFRVAGPLIQFPVVEGQQVSAGELLAQIDPRDYETRLANIIGSLEQARAQLQAMRMARPEDIRKAEAQVASAKAELLKTEADYQRYQQLYVNNNVSKADLDQKRAARDVAKAQVATATESLEIAKRGSRPEDIAAMEAQIRGLEAQQKEAQDALQDTTLRASFAGEVAKTYVQNFQEVQAKQPIVRLQDTSQLKINIDMPETDWALATMEKARINLVARFATFPGQEFPVKVYEVSTEANPQTQTYRVTLVMPRPDGLQILPGMTAEVIADIETEGAASTHFLVPVSAVLADAQGTQYVWVVEPASMTVHKTAVKVGELTEGKIMVLEGLKAGDRIVTAGVQHLVEGQKVRELEKKGGQLL